MAEKPRKGATGSSTLLITKQSVQSSPESGEHISTQSQKYLASLLTSLVLNLDLERATVSTTSLEARVTYFEVLIPDIRDFQFRRNVRAAEVGLKKCE